MEEYQFTKDVEVKCDEDTNPFDSTQEEYLSVEANPGVVRITITHCVDLCIDLTNKRHLTLFQKALRDAKKVAGWK